MCKLYNTWRKVKDTFVRPSVKVYFGLASKDPYCYWTKPKIKLYRRFKSMRFVQDTATIETGYKTERFGNKDLKVKITETSKHKLPKNLKNWDIVWASPIRRKLRKYHLNWIPTIIYLPKFLTFSFINHDVLWKTKYGDIRYEDPPQLSIVLFGISLTITLHSPSTDKYCDDDGYWTSVLVHSFNKSRVLRETIEECGVWSTMTDTPVSYFTVRPQFIQKDRLEEYYAVISDIQAERNQKIV